MASKLAIALAEVADKVSGDVCGIPQERIQRLAELFDTRLADIAAAYRPEELLRCPIVSHHPENCTGCLAAAMRQFILPESNP